MKLFLNECGIVCALGDSLAEVSRRLFAGESGLAATTEWSPGRPIHLGRVSSPLPDGAGLALQQRSRNNRLALGALAQIRAAADAAVTRYGAHRVGVVLGTSTSGSAETEAAMREFGASGALPGQFHYAQQEMGSAASMLAGVLGATGPT